MGQRIGRVEALLEKLMDKVSQTTEEAHGPYAPVVDVLTPSSMPATTYHSRPTPFMSLHDDVVGQGADANTPPIPPQPQSDSVSNSYSNSSLPFAASGGKASGQLGRVEKLRRQLAAMLPGQEEVDYLFDVSYGWWLICRHILPQPLRIPEQDLRKLFNVSTVSRSHPIVIARLLLSLALCIQQLPPHIDTRRLQTKTPLREVMDQIITTVTATVTSDDELIGSMEGIECLLLQGVYQVNAGNLRRAWLTFRKAINVAQLMGLHRVSLKAAQEAPDLMETRRHYTWYQMMKGVCYSWNYTKPHPNLHS